LSDRRPQNAGVPQGAILSPILYLLYSHDLPVPINSTIASFADDTILLSTHKNINTAIHNLQTDTDELTAWFYKWRLDINATKTQTKMFSLRRLNLQNLSKIVINSENIPWNPKDEAVKYLGVYLDTRLSWKIHINKKLQQAYSILTALYPLINRNTPLRHSCTTLLYKSLLRPTLTYACPVWFGASNTNIKKLQTFQNKIIRISLNAPWFVRNTQLQREADIDPIAYHIQDLTLKHHERLAQAHGATTFNLGAPTGCRLKPRLYQDILL